MKRFSSVLTLAIIISLIIGISTAIGARKFPSRTIQVITQLPAGIPAYGLDQLIAERMGKVLGQKMVVNPAKGGGGAVAHRLVLSKPADGYTILDSWVAGLVFAVIGKEKKMGYSYKDYEPLGKVQRYPLTLVVRADAGWNTLEKFLAHARKNPGMTYSCAPDRSVPHGVFAAFLQQAGVKARGVPYGGIGAGFKDLLGGTLDFAVCGYSMIDVFGPKIKTLCAFVDERDPNYPDVPTAKELGYDPGFGSTGDGWNGWVVKKGTPPEKLKILREAFKQVMEDTEFKKKATSMGFMLDFTTPEAWTELAKESTEKLPAALKAIEMEKKQIAK
jgi:tripartite-type tricarboxylate transporter receptor subunit TctC